MRVGLDSAQNRMEDAAENVQTKEWQIDADIRDHVVKDHGLGILLDKEGCHGIGEEIDRKKHYGKKDQTLHERGNDCLFDLVIFFRSHALRKIISCGFRCRIIERGKNVLNTACHRDRRNGKITKTVLNRCNHQRGNVHRALLEHIG